MSALAESVKIALGELYPPAVLVGVRPGDMARDALHCPGAVPAEHFNKALRLAGMHLFGPSKPCICDAHAVMNRPDIWNRCGQVSVREALMGHVCGQP